MSRRLDVSLVIPLHNERENVNALHEEILAAMEGSDRSWEVLYVDDGSTDGTYEELVGMKASSPERTGVIRLRRNFGQTAAIAAGFDCAKGEVIVTLDGDLQNDPAEIPRLLSELDRGFDVVSGWRRHRKDRLLSRRLPSRAANWLISLFTGVSLHDYGCTLKAYRREVVEQLTLYGEMHRFLPALANWVGARISEVEVNHRPRTKGVSKYGIWRTYSVILDLMTLRFLGVHGTKPLHAFGALGIFFVLIGGLIMTFLTYLKYTTGLSFIQSPLLLLAALFVILGGQSFLLGLLAEIAVRTYFESQQKPIYIVKEELPPGPVIPRPAREQVLPGKDGSSAGSPDSV